MKTPSLKGFIGFCLLLTMIFTIIYTRAIGLHYTEGEQLVEFWRNYLFAGSCGLGALWLMT